MPGKSKTEDGDTRPIPKNTIRAWRTHRKMKVKQLAEAAGLSDAAVSDATNRRNDVTGRTLLALATALRTTPGALLDIDPNKSKSWWELWDALDTPEDRERAIRIVEAVFRNER